MKIVVQVQILKDADILISNIHKDYTNKIQDVKKFNREIKLINGCVIKFVSIKSQIDGMNADVAIGLYEEQANQITCRSNQNKRIWDFTDLDNYLKSI